MCKMWLGKWINYVRISKAVMDLTIEKRKVNYEI